MADKTLIQWTDATWNIVTGCSVISPGCQRCYAMRLAGTRLRHHHSRQGLTVPGKNGPVWNGMVRFNVGWLLQPLRWTKPRFIFVAAHGDLFHAAVQDWMLVKIFAVMALAYRHRFQVLTKRPDRMREFLSAPDIAKRVWLAANEIADDSERLYLVALAAAGADWGGATPWPLPNVWLGTSVEDQPNADQRLPHLLRTPAAVRWISAEPLLGAIDLDHYFRAESHRHADSVGANPLHWVVAGGESGPGARPCDLLWIRDLRDQCNDAKVPYFFKQWGAWLPGENQMLQRPCEPAQWQDGEEGQHSSCRDKPEDKTPDWHHFTQPGQPGTFALRIGKKKAGAMLDGREWREMPQ